MARTETVHDLRIVLRTLIGILDQQRDGRAGGVSLEHAGQDFHGVVLAPLGDVARLPRLAPIEVRLDIGLGQRQPRRTTVDDRHVGRPV